MDLQSLLSNTASQPRYEREEDQTVAQSEENQNKKQSFFEFIKNHFENGGTAFSAPQTNTNTQGPEKATFVINAFNPETGTTQAVPIDFAQLKTQNPELATLFEQFSIDISTGLEGTIALNQQALNALSTTQREQVISININDAIINRDENNEQLSLADIFLLQYADQAKPEGAHSLIVNDVNPVPPTQQPAEVNLLKIINLNLTPQQITQIQTENSQDDAVLAFIAGLVQLSQPQTGNNEAPNKDTARAPAINNIPNVTNSSRTDATPLGLLDASNNNVAPLGFTAQENDEGSFIETLKREARGEGTETQNRNVRSSGAETNIRPPSTQNTSATNIQGQQTLPDLKALIPAEGLGIFVEEAGFNTLPPNSVTSLSNLTNIVTQSHSAASPHPATQLVAATLQKSATNGQNTNIRIQLDPPELGRIEVRMDFDKDNTMKATLLIEKPETHFMLQRDAHALERALDQAGVEMSDSALNFELAQDGNEFGQNGGHDSHASPGSETQNKDDEDLSLIETKMTWNIDPETGHTHYSILA